MLPVRFSILRGSALVLLCAAARTFGVAAASASEWPYYGNDSGGMRYSPASQINRSNVHQLKVAWVYHTGDESDGTKYRRKSGFEATPILVDGTLYFSTAFNRVVALNPETGAERWTYDPQIDRNAPYSEGLMNRGVASWLDNESSNQPRRRIFLATIDARLICLSAATGRPCSDFGALGQIDLRQGIQNIIRPGEYEETSPPAIVDGLVIVGSAIADNDRVRSPNGVVRAFDARSGALRWTWHPLVQSGSFKAGAGNAWSVIATDAVRHLVFIPTGSASPDYYGGERKGDDKWADSVVALRASTGEFVWGFQLVHHDLWDYDTASPPLLATIIRGQTKVPVVVQGNKTGNVFILNRETGKPVFPVEERTVPQSNVPGEQTSRTQPFPSAPPPLVPQHVTPAEAWGTSSADLDACRAQMRRLLNQGLFTPPTVSGSLIYPGNIGGLNWSGYAFDPASQTLVADTLRIPFEVRLIPRNRYLPQERAAESGQMRAEISPQHGTPFGMSRAPLLSPSGLPCVAPPWAMLGAINLATGKISWEQPLGTSEGWLPTGAPALRGLAGFGGPIITAGGLVFIGAAWDSYLRAFDIRTGEEMWKGKLPAAGEATPMTYQIGAAGKQFVVIAAGGHGKLPISRSDSLVAFSVP